MDPNKLAREGASLIGAMELHVEDTILAAAELTSFLVRARRETKVSPTFGQKLFEQSSALVTLAVQARGMSVDIHTTAEAATRKLGIQMGPPDLNKPDQEAQPLFVLVDRDAA